ncbi:MAG TPA: carboxypeptidase regulatory-like domain-containing protein [Bryobacteraceae bacterium]|nr:carboxypeptidase regulatory-like domain-containing protein [Bryobacteraceae bacterium]
MISVIVLFAALAAAPGPAKLTGMVTDPSGASIPGATVTVTGAQGFVKAAQADAQGRYTVDGLLPGKYTVRAMSKGFALFEKTDVDLTSGGAAKIDIQMIVVAEKQEVTVSDTAHVDLDPSSNVGAIVLKGTDLDSLSDDPDDLQNDLQALAGPAAGPNGGQIYIDGFTGGQLPPKESIREIRINQNPFSAEYDKLGFGRIEVFTKPGTDKFRGQVFFNFGDSMFNSRNPFAPDKPPYQQKMLSGNLSGPLGKKASFFIDAERRDQQETSVISALTLTGPLSQAVLAPQVRTTVSPRIDYQLNSKDTLVGRYRYEYSTLENQGIGVFTLPTRAYNVQSGEQSASLTNTIMVSSTVINETRFQFYRDTNLQLATDEASTISVLGAFTGGGAPFGLGQSYSNENHYELQNYTSIVHGTHFFKFGGRLRDVTLSNDSTQNYNGTFTFTSLENYNLGQPSQFSITGGTPTATVKQYDAGLFATDDWRLRPNFTLSLGLRYETQDNIGDHADVAPRVGFAWGIGGGKSGQPKTVIRGGFGIFYDRFGESFAMQALQQNGILQQQYFVTDPTFYPNIPLLSSLPLISQTIRRIDANLHAPYTLQGAMGVERQLPKNITLAVTYTHSRGVDVLRSRNINAPLPGTFNPLVPGSGEFPYGDVGNIYMYESSGLFTQNQLITNINARINAKLNLFGYYALSKALSNTDSAGTFPSNQYNEQPDWGRAGFDVRNRIFIGGSLLAPLGLRFSPFIIAQSGSPFDITLGRDLNGDSIYNDRPSFASSSDTTGVVATRYGVFETNPQPGEQIIPRNYGQGPGMFSVNLRLSRTFGFGEPRGSSVANAGGGGMPGGGLAVGGMRGGGGGGPRGGPGGMRGGPFGDAVTNKRYNVTVGISARNLFNHTNLAPPVGDLLSPLFGTSNALAGGFFGSATANRRIEMQLRFSF